MALIVCGLAAACIGLVGGCASPAYYGQAVAGHLSIMSRREDIDGLIDSGEAGDELRRELLLAREIRSFASSQLGLPDNDSYRQFVKTGRDAVTWNVIAAPEFSLEPKQWCFLVAGCVSYRGYFKQQKAEAYARKLEEKSLDVFISPAIAYSTLGWFDDPLLDTMLRYSDTGLAGLIFHELAHQQLYVKNDTAFNESYASFIEEIGVDRWLRQTSRVGERESWLRRRRASERFDAFLRETRKQLESEYSSGHGEVEMRRNKQAIIESMGPRYREIVQREWDGTDYFGNWFSFEVNNARLALIDSYQGGICAFKNLYEQAGRDIVRFQQLAAGMASEDAGERSAWLEQPCDPTGPDGQP